MPILIANSNDNWITGLTDPAISAQVSGFAATGSLTYTDLVAVLNTVVSGGTAVTTAEYHDLQAIASNLNIGLATSDDIASEFIQLVDGASVDSNMSNGDSGNGSEANNYWNGGSASSSTLGDLAVGTTSGNLTKLIEKWFDGADMPDPTISGSNETVLYQAFSLPLYGASAGPVVGDIAQGNDGDCELCAGMVEVTQNDPAAIESMIVEEAPGVYGVRFYVDGNEMWVTVNDKLPVYTSNEGGGLVYMNEDTSGNPLWPDLIEKAYAELSATGLIGHPSANSYTNITADYASDVLPDLTDCTSANYYNYNDSNWSADKELFIQALAAGDDVILESYGSTSSGGKQELVDDHAFAVISYDSRTGDFLVRNPWGTENVGGPQDYDTQFEVSMNDIFSVEGDIVIANTATSPIEILTAPEGYQNNAPDTNPQTVVPENPETVATGVAVPVASLFSVIDTNGLAVTEYQFQLVGPGTLNLNGVSQSGEFEVSAADLSQVTYVPGAYDANAPQGNAHILVWASDGTTLSNGTIWSPSTDISLTIGSQPVAVTSAINVVVAPSQKIAADKLFGGIGPVAGYDVTQVSAGSFSENNFSNSALSSVTYTAPSIPGVVTIAVYDYDNSGDGSYTQNIQVLVGTSVAVATQNYDNGELSGAQAIADTAANVFANLDGLQTMVAAGVLQGIKLTDATKPTETITSTQETADAGVLSLLAGQVNLEVTTDILIWANGVSGDFAVASNWNNDAVPGPANDAEISPSATYTVSSLENETIASVTTAAGATLDITSGTFTITSGTGPGGIAGTIIVGSGATLELDGNVTNSGTIEALLGATIELSGAITGPGSLTVSSGGMFELLGSATASGLTVDSGGILEIGPGKVLSGFTVSGGAVVEASAGGVVSNTTVSSGGTLAVLPGGTADPTKILSDGSEIVSAGGTDDGAQISGGVQIDYGSASGATVFTGSQVVEAGGTASGTIVSSGGTLDLLSGGSAPGAITKTGGIVEIGSGSTAGPQTVSGIFEIGSGATASAMTVSSGGKLIVESGGSDLSAIVSSGGTAVVSSGGVDSGTTILKGGVEIVWSGGAASGALVSSGGTEIVSSGGSAGEITIGKGGTAIVSVGGTASGTTVSSGGELIVASGGRVIGTAVKSGGTALVSSGGIGSVQAAMVDSGTLINSGTITVAAGVSLSLAAATVSNTGTITLLGTNASLLIDNSVHLSGTGTVSLAGDGTNIITDGGSAVTLTTTNIIAGAGAIGQGDNKLTLVNSGTIDANSSTALTISTGSSAVTNAGTLEATLGGTLDIDNAVSDAKTIEALGASATVTITNKIIDTAAGLILASGSGALVELDGVAISGGKLQTSGSGALIETVGAGTDTIDGGTIVSGSLVDVGIGGALTLSGGTVGSGAVVNVASNGTLTVSGTLGNSGTLFASDAGSTVDIVGVVNGGIAAVGNGIVEIAKADAVDVSFESGGTGGLELASASAYTGKISGFGSNTTQFIDLTAIAFNSSTESRSYSGSTASGLLTITSGGHTVASLHLVGPYVTSNFTLSSGAGGSTEIIDPPVAGGVGSANAALFGSYMAASFVSAAGQFDGAAVATEGQTPHPVLTNPS